MNEKIQNEIIKIIITLPGVAGFANIDFSKSNIPLSEKNWSKAINISEDGKSISLMIALIFNANINAKVIIGEIVGSIENMFKKMNTKLSDIRIYIRGIK